LIVAKKAVAANDLKEFIAWLKADPGKAAQATGGVAATSHIAGMFFQQISGTRFTLVPYRGAGPAMKDLIAGQVDIMIDPAASTWPQVRAGRIKAFAVTAKRRLAVAPDISDRGRIAPTLFWPCETRTSTCRSFATISILQLHAELAHEGSEDREACVARGDAIAAPRGTP
jgi:hypothetical protein